MKFNSVPAWSFGGKHKQKDRKLGDPGPGYYGLKKQTDFNRKGGYSLGRAERGTDLGNKRLSLGPGQYNYDYTSIGKNGVSLKGSRRNK